MEKKKYKKTMQKSYLWEICMVFCIMVILPVNISFLFLNGEQKRKEPAEEELLNSELEWQVLHELAAAISPEYEPEALKAQAVILRTNILADMEEGRERKVFPLLFSYREEWGVQYEENCSRLTTAVEETKGMYLDKDKKPMRACYFKLSNGRTRNASECLNGRFEEFTLKDCSADLQSKEFLQKTFIDKNEFTGKLNRVAETVSTYEEWRKANPTYINDSAGYVLEVQFGKIIVGGEVFRQAFELPSADFTLKFGDDGVEIVTKGVGCGIGFCQYTANELAKKGKDFIGLLNYFFTNIAISKTE